MQDDSRIHCSLDIDKRKSSSGAEKLRSDGSDEREPTISEGTKIAQLTEQNNGWMEQNCVLCKDTVGQCQRQKGAVWTEGQYWKWLNRYKLTLNKSWLE